jgi:hypothetical protein
LVEIFFKGANISRGEDLIDFFTLIKLSIFRTVKI